MRRRIMYSGYTWGLSGGLVLLSTAVAGAQAPLTGELNVQIEIQAECELGTITDINFGTEGVLSSAVEDEGSIAVTCTSGTPYNLALDEGLGAGATEALRLMTGPGGTISYELSADAGFASSWGTGADALSGTGTGASFIHNVYGRVPIQDTPAAGVYQDTVTVTLSY